MTDIDRPGFSIEAQTSPIPEFESKNIRGSTDLQYNAILTGTMYGSCGNQDVVMLINRPLLNVLLGIELRSCFLRPFQFFDHVFRNDVVSQSQINMRSVFH